MFTGYQPPGAAYNTNSNLRYGENIQMDDGFAFEDSNSNHNNHPLPPLPAQYQNSAPVPPPKQYNNQHAAPIQNYSSYRGFTPTIDENTSTFSRNPKQERRRLSMHPNNNNNNDFESVGVIQQPGMVPPDNMNDPMISNFYEPGRPNKDKQPGMLKGKGRFRWDNIKWTKLPYFCWLVSLIQIAVFIAELAKMGQLTGSPIQTKPSFNPMIGPSSYVQINMGARFTPCMHAIKDITDDRTINFPCPNSTDATTNVCSLSELCGMGGLKDDQTPNQWWRFITPIFLHGGFVHIGFNLLLQLKLGADMEKDIGILRFFLVYFASGIGGFVLGGNFTPNGISSTGASGSLFGVISIDLLDLLFNWQLYVKPWRNLIIHILEIGISFVLGLLPGLDNFSHIGGFAMGILVGTAILRSPLPFRVRSVDTINHGGDGTSYIDQNGVEQMSPPIKTEQRVKVVKFHWSKPHKHFKNRKPMWFVWLFVRAACIGLAVAYFVALINQFENGGGHCSWCKRLSCLPVNGWCDQGKIKTE